MMILLIILKEYNKQLIFFKINKIPNQKVIINFKIGYYFFFAIINAIHERYYIKRKLYQPNE